MPTKDPEKLRLQAERRNAAKRRRRLEITTERIRKETAAAMMQRPELDRMRYGPKGRDGNPFPKPLRGYWAEMDRYSIPDPMAKENRYTENPTRPSDKDPFVRDGLDAVERYMGTFRNLVPVYLDEFPEPGEIHYPGNTIYAEWQTANPFMQKVRRRTEPNLVTLDWDEDLPLNKWHRQTFGNCYVLATWHANNEQHHIIADTWFVCPTRVDLPITWWDLFFPLVLFKAAYMDGPILYKTWFGEEWQMVGLYGRWVNHYPPKTGLWAGHKTCTIEQDGYAGYVTADGSEYPAIRYHPWNVLLSLLDDSLSPSKHQEIERIIETESWRDSTPKPARGNRFCLPSQQPLAWRVRHVAEWTGIAPRLYSPKRSAVLSLDEARRRSSPTT